MFRSLRRGSRMFLEIPPLYFDFRTYTRIVRLILRDEPSPRRWLAHALILALLSFWAGWNALFLMLDRLLCPIYRAVEIREPVFILGNARSGTTLFHRLLCLDRQRFVPFLTWEILFPSLLQKRLLRAFFGGFGRFFPRTLERLVAFEARQFSSLKRQHPIGIDRPEEDEFLMLIPFASPTLNVLFPYAAELEYLARFEQRPARVRSRILRFYRECVQRQLLFHADSVGAASRRCLLSKNPSFVTRIRSLAEEFPDARFVYLIRNPFETIPSLLRLLDTIWRGLGLDSARIDSSVRALARGCMHDYGDALAALDELPPERRAIVRYTDLVADPRACVEGVYAQLGLDVSPEFAERLEEQSTKQRRYHSENAYSLEQFGLTVSEVQSAMADVIERFGFRPEDAPEHETKEML